MSRLSEGPGCAPRELRRMNKVDQELKNKIAEIVELVSTVPANLQEKCFEVLLTDHLSREKAATKKPPEPSAGATQPAEPNSPASVTEITGGEDVTLSDIHVKVRKFLEKSELGIQHLNQLFYKEGAEIKPLYEDLKTTKTAESQVRIGLLIALRNAMQSGDFVFSGEQVREECRLRKCYDQNNFAACFKNNTKLFDGFEKYDSQKPDIKLSEAGRSELANLIKEMQ